MKKRNLSYIYLVIASLGLLGYLGYISNSHNSLAAILMLFFIPLYLATISLLIFVHPIICIIYIAKYYKNKKSINLVATHFLWSLVIGIISLSMLLNGYVLTA